MNDEYMLHDNTVSIRPQIEIKEFALDTETVNLIHCLQYIDQDAKGTLSFLNEYNNSIYFFDYESGCFSHRLPVTINPNTDNKSEKIQAYHYVNDNQLYVYAYTSGTLWEIDSASNVRKKYQLSDVSNSNFQLIRPYAYCNTLSPLLKYGDSILCVGMVTGETNEETSTNRPIGFIYNLHNRQSHYVVNYPEPYQTYNWAGNLTYRLPRYDTDATSMIVCFPASHRLLRYDLATGQETSYYAGSSAIESIRSFPSPKNQPINEVEAWQWYMTNPSYEGILYDKYKNLYYRIARLPVEVFDPDEKWNRKPVVIIVLDSNLNYVGEAVLPTDIVFFPGNCFVSPDGLNIQVMTEDEDKLTFYQYQFTYDNP